MRRGRVGAKQPQHGGDVACQRRAGMVLIALLAVLEMWTPPAHAGTYVMRNCDVPGHPPTSLGPWVASSYTPEPTPKMTVGDACASGGGVGFTFAGARTMTPGSAWARITIARPSSGPQSEIRLVSVAMWYAARFGGSGQELGLIASEASSDKTLTNHWRVAGRPGGERLSFERRLSRADADGFSVGMYCGPVQDPIPPDPCVADDATPFLVRGMELTLSEDKPPTVLEPAGTLLAEGSQGGIRTVSYEASDLHSGLAGVDVLLGGRVVKSRDLTPRCFHSDFTVCPTADEATLEVDTRVVPDGSYDLALRVRDAAGNEQVVRGQHPVEVANGTPADGPYAIAARFTGTSRSSVTVPYGRRVTVRGGVTHGGRAVAAGTRIEVLERLDRRGARERLTRTVVTKADGSFSTGLATSRPSRVVRLAYRSAAGGRFVSRALTVRVLSASRLRASLHGRLVRFSGRVVSGPMPKGGKRVQMEGRSPGSAWTTFKTLQTDAKGRFAGTYRLRVRRPGVVLKVRAVVPRETGYGYLGSRSRAVTLRVR